MAISFKNCHTHIAQRNALIAIHETDFNEGIKNHVKPHVMPCLQGTYTRLHDKFRGQYFRPLERTSAASLYDEISHYD